jgi:hypothetical protein
MHFHRPCAGGRHEFGACRRNEAGRDRRGRALDEDPVQREADPGGGPVAGPARAGALLARRDRQKVRGEREEALRAFEEAQQLPVSETSTPVFGESLLRTAAG